MIPRIIHRIWLGSAIPAEFESIWQRWRALFPEYKLVTWGEKDLAQLSMPSHYFRARTYAERSDIARLRIMQQVGGIYTDCDVTPIARFDSLWLDTDVLVAFKVDDRFVCNGAFACAPGTAVMRLIERMVRVNAYRHPPDDPASMRTGPYPFTAAIEYQSSIDPSGIRVFPCNFLDLGSDPSPQAVLRTRFRDGPTWAKVPADEVKLLTNGDRWRERYAALRFGAWLLPTRIRRRLYRHQWFSQKAI